MTWSENLAELRKELEAQHGYPCITLTMPTGRNMPANAEDPVRLKNLVHQAGERLRGELGKREAAAAIANLEQAAEGVDHDDNLDGLAIFANSNLARVLKTRFEMPAQVAIDEQFALRPILRAQRRAEPYSVLVLSKGQAKLYQGVREDLVELRGHGFPADVHHSPAGGHGVNPSQVEDETRRVFVKHCAEALLAHPDASKMVVVTGTEDTLADFEASHPHRLAVLGHVSGNMIDENPATLGRKAWEVVRGGRRALSQRILARLDEARSAHRYAAGLTEIGPLALQSRVELMVCGFDYAQPARLDPATGSLVPIDAPQGPGDLDDAVDWVAQQVLDRGGDVRLVENDLMTETPIAAVLRY
jgi:hypothetical protein